MDNKQKLLKGIVVGVLAAVMLFSGWKIIEITGGYRKSRSVYSSAADSYVTVATTPNRFLPAEEGTGTEREDFVEASIQAELDSIHVGEKAPVSVDFDAMVRDHPDVVGWIFIPGTEINYPVLCGTEDNYYIDHLYDGESSSNGSIFMDRRNQDDFSDKHTILYGHHMKDGSMFAGLDGYREQEFTDAHGTGWLLTPDKSYRLTPFSAYITGSTSSAYETEFFTNSSLLEWCDERMDNSCVEFQAEPQAGDAVVTLSTCSYEYADARFVVHCIVEEVD